MILSRFWYLILAVAAGAAVTVALLTDAASTRKEDSRTEQELQRDHFEVDLLLRLDARARLEAIGPIAADPKILDALRGDMKRRDGATETPLETHLRALNSQMKELQGDFLIAMNSAGQIAGAVGIRKVPKGSSLKSLPVVEKALLGHIVDDVLVMNTGVFRVAARPVIHGGRYVGAILHGHALDDELARRIAEGMGKTTVVFFWNEAVIGHHMPAAKGAVRTEDVRSQIDTGMTALGNPFRTPSNAYVMFSKVKGSAAALGVGYALARPIESEQGQGVLDSISKEDQVPQSVLMQILAAVAIATLLGVGFTWLERDRPLHRLIAELSKNSPGAQPRIDISRLRGAHQVLGQRINEALESNGSNGTGRIEARELKELLDAKPQKEPTPLFGFATAAIDDDKRPNTPPKAAPQQPKPEILKAAPPRPKPEILKAKHLPPDSDEEETADGKLLTQEIHYRETYERYIQTRIECGESTRGVTYERFLQTLKKNHERIAQQHGTNSVVFKVYVKNGKAALKATPQKTS